MIETIRVRADAPEAGALARALAALEGGALLIYPTDTLYALGGRAVDPSVARKVREAKAREAVKPLPVIAADREQARGLVSAWPDAAERLAGRHWPGPLTLVLPAAPGLPAELTAGSGTVGVRVPALLLARELCRGAGPLISTSANLAGASPAITCQEAVAAVGGAAALALDAGPGSPLGSTVVDLSGGPPRLLRAGPVAWEEIQAVLLSVPPC